MQLILRQYDLSNGKVRIDDENIEKFNIKKLRPQISILSQEPVLFSGTIKDNISYGFKATDKDIEDATIKAQAIDFILSHQDGFDRKLVLKEVN